jgi:hypothetical protein
VTATLHAGLQPLALSSNCCCCWLAWLGATPPHPSRHPQLHLPCQPAPLILPLLQARVVARALQEYFCEDSGVHEQSAHASCPAGWLASRSVEQGEAHVLQQQRGMAGQRHEGRGEWQAGAWRWGSELRCHNGCLSSLAAPAWPSPPAGRRCAASQATRKPAGMQHTHAPLLRCKQVGTRYRSYAHTPASPAGSTQAATPPQRQHPPHPPPPQPSPPPWPPQGQRRR